jgi:nucleotide-binding universal stress UspA family protein
MIKITLPDGSVREYAAGTSSADVARSISEGLARKVLAAEVNGDLIIIMNEQEINTTGFFMGPYAQQVVNHSKIPVLSIRPSTGALSNVTPY